MCVCVCDWHFWRLLSRVSQCATEDFLLRQGCLTFSILCLSGFIHLPIHRCSVQQAATTTRRTGGLLVLFPPQRVDTIGGRDHCCWVLTGCGPFQYFWWVSWITGSTDTFSISLFLSSILLLILIEEQRQKSVACEITTPSVQTRDCARLTKYWPVRTKKNPQNLYLTFPQASLWSLQSIMS